MIPKRSSARYYDIKAPWANENPAELPVSAEDFDSISCHFKSGSSGPLPPPVQFIHESVREFFLFGQGFNILDRSTFPKTIADRHCSLMETCIKYISLDEISPLTNKNKVRLLNTRRTNVQYRFADELNGFPFLPYSVNYLFRHALEAERLGSYLEC